MASTIFLNVAHNFKNAQTAFNAFSGSVKGAGGTFNGANKNLNRMQTALRNMTADANRSVTSFGNLGRASNNLNFAATAAKATMLGRALANIVQSSLNSIEVTNMFNVAMGSTAVETNKVLVNMSELSGLDLTNLQQATGTINNLARSMGLAEDAAQKVSLNTVKMATDLSSLFNVTFEQVIGDLRSGLIGQTETVYKYGQDLTEASLKQTALALGIEKSVRQMTQGEKMFLRMMKAMESSGLAVGDFARTIETPANQLRLLAQNFATLGRAVGSVFIPMLQTVLPVVRAIVMVLTNLFQLIASFFGYTSPSIENVENGFVGVGDSIEDATDSVGNLKKAIKDLSAPFDELNAINITSPTGGGGGSGGIGGGLNQDMIDAMQEYDSMLGGISQKANKIRDTLLEWLGIQRQINVATGEAEVVIEQGGFVERLKSAIDRENFESVGTILADKVNEVIEKIPFAKTGAAFGGWIQNALTTVTTFLEKTKFEDLATGISEFITEAIEEIKPATLAKAIVTPIKRSIAFLKTLLQNLPWDTAIPKLFEALALAIKELPVEDITDIANQIVDILLKAVDELNDSDVVTNLEDKIKEVIEGIEWEDLGKLFNELVTTNFEIRTKLLGAVLSAGIKSAIKKIKDDHEQAKIDSKIFWDSSTMGKWWNEEISPWFTSEKWSNLFTRVKTGFSDGWQSISEWWNSNVIVKWWDDEVSPIFSEGNWEPLFGGVKDGFESGWADVTEWWNSLGIVKWWDDYVSPWFTIEKWTTLFTNVKSGFKDGWNTVVAWWNNTAIVKWWTDNVSPWFTKKKWTDLLVGMKDGFVAGWKNAVNGAIDLLNRLIRYVNEKLNFSFDGLSLLGEEVIPAFKFQLFTIPEITPLARGGMLEKGSLFQAGEAGSELLGSFRGQQTVMPLENSGFVEAMADAVYDAVVSAQESGGGQVIENVVNVDGEVLYRNQQKVAKRVGITFASPQFVR